MNLKIIILVGMLFGCDAQEDPFTQKTSHDKSESEKVTVVVSHKNSEGNIKETQSTFPKNVASETDAQFDAKIKSLTKKMDSSNKLESLWATRMLKSMKTPSKVLIFIVSYYCDKNGIPDTEKHKKNKHIKSFSDIRLQKKNIKLPDCSKEITYFINNPTGYESDSYLLRQIKMFLFDFSFEWGDAIDGEIYTEFETESGEKSFNQLLDFIYDRYDYSPDGKSWGKK